MKCLNKRAEVIFRELIDGLNEPGDHRKIENSGGTFMALSIDVLSVGAIGTKCAWRWPTTGSRTAT